MLANGKQFLFSLLQLHKTLYSIHVEVFICASLNIYLYITMIIIADNSIGFEEKYYIIFWISRTLGPHLDVEG